jgi:hypothetical protein
MKARAGAFVRSLSARTVALLAAGAAVVFCLVRSWRIGGAGAFVVAGTPYTDPATVPGGIPVLAESGFDGQFFYRLAADPTELGMGRIHGIAFDYKVRSGRIGYPVLGWLGSFGGRHGLLALALIVVNVVAVGVLAWVAAHLAADHGRAPAWGLAVAGYFGFAIVLGRDLSELVAAAAVFAAILLVSRSRYWWASAASSAAVLTREQAVLVVVALCAGVFVHERRRGSWRAAGRAAATVALAPALCFLVWQSIAASVVGQLPATSSSSANTTFPFADVPRSLRGWIAEARDGFSSAHLVSVGSSLALLTFLALTWLTAVAFTSGGLRVAWNTRPWEPLVALAGFTVLVCSSWAVLSVPADFRQSYELAGASWLVLWSASPRRRAVALAVVAPVTLLAFAFRCMYL